VNTETGIAALRAMALVRVKRQNYGVPASAVGLHPEAFRDFAEGRKALPPDKLQALAIELTGGHAVYDPAIDRMRSAYRAEPKPLCAAYPKFAAPPSMGLGSYEDGAPQPVKPEKPKETKKRAGWLGGFW
jgi:hypothetical protein